MAKKAKKKGNLTCPFCGKSDFTRAAGLGNHKANCPKNPNATFPARIGGKARQAQRRKKETMRYRLNYCPNCGFHIGQITE